MPDVFQKMVEAGDVLIEVCVTVPSASSAVDIQWICAPRDALQLLRPCAAACFGGEYVLAPAHAA